MVRVVCSATRGRASRTRGSRRAVLVSLCQLLRHAIRHHVSHLGGQLVHSLENPLLDTLPWRRDGGKRDQAIHEERGGRGKRHGHRVCVKLPEPTARQQ
eukprot:scaffold4633_cov114-Isochrysis_galbana.AAC.15